MDQGSITKGGGIWDPKVCLPKIACEIFPIVNFVFSHDGHFGLEGRGGGVPHLLRWCTAILTLPWRGLTAVNRMLPLPPPAGVPSPLNAHPMPPTPALSGIDCLPRSCPSQVCPPSHTCMVGLPTSCPQHRLISAWFTSPSHAFSIKTLYGLHPISCRPHPISSHVWMIHLPCSRPPYPAVDNPISRSPSSLISAAPPNTCTVYFRMFPCPPLHHIPVWFSGPSPAHPMSFIAAHWPPKLLPIPCVLLHHIRALFAGLCALLRVWFLVVD